MKTLESLLDTNIKSVDSNSAIAIWVAGMHEIGEDIGDDGLQSISAKGNIIDATKASGMIDSCLMNKDQAKLISTIDFNQIDIFLNDSSLLGGKNWPFRMRVQSHASIEADKIHNLYIAGRTASINFGEISEFKKVDLDVWKATFWVPAQTKDIAKYMSGIKGSAEIIEINTDKDSDFDFDSTVYDIGNHIKTSEVVVGCVDPDNEKCVYYYTTRQIPSRWAKDNLDVRYTGSFMSWKIYWGYRR